MADAAISVEVRDERTGDESAIFALTQAAFADREFSSGKEGPIIEFLRADGDLTLSLVAERVRGNGTADMVGHIAFSPVSVAGETDGVFALGPVAVRPDLRHRRIGTALIEAGLERLRDLDAKACVLVGDPQYYSRFGFRGGVGLAHAGLPSRVVQGLWFDGKPRSGIIDYAPAFGRS